MSWVNFLFSVITARLMGARTMQYLSSERLPRCWPKHFESNFSSVFTAVSLSYDQLIEVILKNNQFII